LHGAPGPVVFDVRIDPAIAMPKLDRVANMIPGSPPASPPRESQPIPRLHLAN
jgi:hypothetical protein